jgi:integral membrane protein
MKNPVGFLRITGLIEAISYMILVGVAMPLKYIWKMPEAVRVVGMAHGVLFVLFCFALIRASLAAKWPLARIGLVFLASLLPFGPFLLDRRMKQWERDANSSFAPK